MAMAFMEKKISRVRVVDDDASARESYTYTVEDFGAESESVEGPLPDVVAFVHETKQRADAALIDFHLRKKSYAMFNGAQPTAMLNQKGCPTVLCTRYVDDDIDNIRPYRKHIPALFRPEELDPDALGRGFEWCFKEYCGKVPPSRRLWRTLVRVEDVESEGTPRFFFVVIPAWDPKKGVRLRIEDLPENVRKILVSGKRLHARVNLGAEGHEELFFDDWEVD